MRIAISKANDPASAHQSSGNSVADVGGEQLRRWLRESIEEARDEAGRAFKFEAIAAALEVSETYLSQMLSLDPRNQKPVQWRHVFRLPDAIECIFAKKYCESFGAIVVGPVTPDQARRCLAIGLFGSDLFRRAE